LGSTLLPTKITDWFGRRLTPLGPKAFVRAMLALCTADPARVSPEAIEAHLEMARERLPWNGAAFNQAARSTMLTLMSSRAFWGRMRAVTAPTLLIGGSKDRLVPPSVLEEASRHRPDWVIRVLDGVGHMPQLEDPAATAQAMLEWLNTELPRAA
jgi:pimeloyl-ACP methyl ester carboxylesterase